MPARLALFATLAFWMAYESHFSSEFFASTVQTSLADILGGIDEAIAQDRSVAVAEHPTVADNITLAGWSATTEDQSF